MTQVTRACVMGPALGAALLLCAPAAHAQVWTCGGYEWEAGAFVGGNDTVTGGSLACPSDSAPFDLGVVAGTLSHASDGDHTTFHVEATVGDPPGSLNAYLFAMGYFWLDFDEATLASFDYAVEHVEGNEGDISVLAFCDHPNASALPRPGGVDFYFGPGGGACQARVEPSISLDDPGTYEANLTVDASSAPLPITPSLAVEILDSYSAGDSGLARPNDVGADSNGNVFVTSEGSTGVYQINPEGAVTAVDTLPSMDVFGLAVGPDDDVTIVRRWNGVATRITPGVGATDIIDASGDGAGNPLDAPVDVAVDAAGNAYIAGHWSHNVFRVTPGGTITEIIDASGDGTHPLTNPSEVAVDAAGNVYVAGASSHNAFRITPGGTITQILDASGDGAGNILDTPYGVVASPAGDVYVAGQLTNNVFHVSPGGVVTEVLDATGNGSGHVCDLPLRMALDPQQNLFVACYRTDTVLQVAPDGTVTELMDESGDGAANPMRGPHGVAYRNGRLYVTGVDTHNAYRLNLARRVPVPWPAAIAVAVGVLALGRRQLRRDPTG